MIKVNAIDLDGTLINYDSFRMYLIEFLKRGKFLIIFYYLQKILGFIDNDSFKKKCVIYCRNSKRYKLIIEKIVYKIYDELNFSVLNKISNNSDINTINVLCTASIDDYVKPLAELLKYEFIATKITNNIIFHNYGEQKKNNFCKIYPCNFYYYNYAISDSISDIELLKMFQFYEIIQ